MPTVESTALDQVIVAWKDIYLQNKKIEKHFNHKMKVFIKWNQK